MSLCYAAVQVQDAQDSASGGGARAVVGSSSVCILHVCTRSELPTSVHSTYRNNVHA